MIEVWEEIKGDNSNRYPEEQLCLGCRQKNWMREEAKELTHTMLCPTLKSLLPHKMEQNDHLLVYITHCSKCLYLYIILTYPGSQGTPTTVQYWPSSSNTRGMVATDIILMFQIYKQNLHIHMKKNSSFMSWENNYGRTPPSLHDANADFTTSRDKVSISRFSWDRSPLRGKGKGKQKGN